MILNCSLCQDERELVVHETQPFMISGEDFAVAVDKPFGLCPVCDEMVKHGHFSDLRTRAIEKSQMTVDAGDLEPVAKVNTMLIFEEMVKGFLKYRVVKGQDGYQ